MVHVVLARERFEQTRAAINRLDDVKRALMYECEDWKPPSLRVRTGVSDPTGKAAIYRADDLPAMLDNLRREEHELTEYIGTTLRLLEAVRAGLGDKYANILDWVYIDRMSWQAIADAYHVSRSTGHQWRDIAFDWIDTIGIKELLMKHDYTAKKLVDTKGKSHRCHVGLVDGSGGFFLLLDENKPAHYLRFSNEDEALTAYANKCDRLEEELSTLREAREQMTTNGGYIRTALAAKLLGVPQTEVMLLVSARKLDIKRQGGLLWVSLVSVGEYLESR